MATNVVAWIVRAGRVLTTSHLPGVDRRLRFLKTTRAVLVEAAVVSALCGHFLHPRGFVPAAGIGAVLVLGLVWPWLALRGMSGSLAFGRPRVREGGPVEIRLRLRSRAPWKASGLVLRGDLGGGSEARLATSQNRRSIEVLWEFVPACRGDYPKDVPRIATSFPFGLREASRRLEVRGGLLVWPRTFPVGPIPALAASLGREGPARRDRAGDCGDVLGLRPYRRGDSSRRVHWPQTARQGRLIVRELQATAVPSVQVVLDLHENSHLGDGPDNSLEWTIRIAASFLEGWTALGAEMGAVLGGRVLAPSGPPQARTARLLDALARVGAGGPTLQDALAGPACRRFRGGLRLIVTTDRGLAGLKEVPRLAGRDRIIALNASAFAGEPAVEEPSRIVRPWIWIDDPSRVPQLLRKARKEAALA